MKLFLLQEWDAVNASKKSGAGTGEVIKSKWKFYDELTLLIPILLVRDGADSWLADSLQLCQGNQNISYQYVDVECCS